MNNISLKNGRYNITHCAGHVSANTRLHQLPQGNKVMGTANQYTQVDGHIHMVGRSISNLAFLHAAVLLMLF